MSIHAITLLLLVDNNIDVVKDNATFFKLCTGNYQTLSPQLRMGFESYMQVIFDKWLVSEEYKQGVPLLEHYKTCLPEGSLQFLIDIYKACSNEKFIDLQLFFNTAIMRFMEAVCLFEDSMSVFSKNEQYRELCMNGSGEIRRLSFKDYQPIDFFNDPVAWVLAGKVNGVFAKLVLRECSQVEYTVNTNKQEGLFVEKMRKKLKA